MQRDLRVLVPDQFSQGTLNNYSHYENVPAPSFVFGPKSEVVPPVRRAGAAARRSCRRGVDGWGGDSQIILVSKMFSLNGAALDAQSRQLIDVSEWMRALAVESLAGVADTYRLRSGA